MIFIYRIKGSDGAAELAFLRQEGFIRLRQSPNAPFNPDRPMDKIRWERAIRQPDRYSVVCWGEHIANADSRVRLLNNAPLINKYEQALLLIEKGVSTIEVSLTKPEIVPMFSPPAIDPAIEAFNHAQILAEEFCQIREVSRSQPFRDGLVQISASLRDLVQAVAVDPPVPQILQPADTSEWLGRTKNHIAGQDLLNLVSRPDFYVKKLSLVSEYRVHSFRGVSIRAGKKIPVEGATPHPWVRSLIGGWKISYDGQSVKQRHRDLAHEAVKALGLDFGAVDLGETSEGKLIVLEVNRAPGLDGGTISQYAKHLKRWDAGLPAVEET